MPGAHPCAADRVPDLQDAIPNNLVYPRLCTPQLESGLPAVHVERQWGHSCFCLEASNWRNLVGSSDGSEASVFCFLKPFSVCFSILWSVGGGGPLCRAASCDCGTDDSYVEQPQDP